MSADIQQFQSLLDSSFSFSWQKNNVAAELVEVKPLTAHMRPGDDGEAQREPFSLLFKVPDGQSLPQATYMLAHETFDKPMALFIVPISADSDGTYYEALFT